MSDYVVTKKGKTAAEMSDFKCDLCECEFSYPSKLLQPGGLFVGATLVMPCPNCNAEARGELKFVEAAE